MNKTRILNWSILALATTLLFGGGAFAVLASSPILFARAVASSAGFLGVGLMMNNFKVLFLEDEPFAKEELLRAVGRLQAELLALLAAIEAMDD